MAKRGRPPKVKGVKMRAGFTTRDPEPVTRDPVIEKPKRIYESRAYIKEPMPIICPSCGRNTRIDGGTHPDPVRRVIHKYRTCQKCGKKLTSVRKMTQDEVDKYCGFAQSIKEFEEDN